MLQKTNVPGYLKDKETGLIINTDIGDYERIIAARQKKRAEEARERRLETVEQRMSGIEQTLEEMKTLLMAVLKQND